MYKFQPPFKIFSNQGCEFTFYNVMNAVLASSKSYFNLTMSHVVLSSSAPQEIHPDRDHGDHRGREEEDEDSEDPENESNHLNKYVIDPDMIHPQSPYEAVLASEPDLSRRPQKSALKKAQSPSPASGQCSIISYLLVSHISF